MKLKHFIEELQYVRAFEAPKVALEQYATPPELAARMLMSIDADYGDIAGRSVVDLGCGTGMLAIGCVILGSDHVLGIDMDTDALEQAQSNCEELEADVDFIQTIITDEWKMPVSAGKCDTVITNPPFGAARGCKGADMKFLKAALSLNPDVIYSLHKSSTREHIGKKAEEWGVGFEVVATLKFKLPNTQRFHKKKNVDIDVDLLRLDCTKVSPRR